MILPGMLIGSQLAKLGIHVFILDRVVGESFQRALLVDLERRMRGVKSIGVGAFQPYFSAAMRIEKPTTMVINAAGAVATCRLTISIT